MDLHGVCLILPARYPSIEATMLIPVSGGRVVRPPSQQIECVRQQRQNRRKRTLRPGRATRQIDNQRATQSPAHRSAQSGKRSMQQAVGAHLLRQSLDHPLADLPCGLGSYIPRAQPRSARGHDKTCALCMASQRLGNLIQLIWQRLHRDHTDPGRLQRLADRRSGDVRLVSTPATVADRQDNRTNIGGKDLIHRSSLRVLR
jgi:hypothetical protein